MEVNEEQFTSEVLAIFPDLKPDMDEFEDLVHLKMDRFRYRLETELNSKNKDTVLRAYMLAEKCYRYGTKTLKDAVDTSFVEPLFVGHGDDVIKWGWDLLPSMLQKLYVTFWGKNAI